MQFLIIFVKASICQWKSQYSVSFSFPFIISLLSFPSINTLPLVGRSTPPIKCNKVDLPEPDAPIIATNSPFSTVNDTSS